MNFDADSGFSFNPDDPNLPNPPLTKVNNSRNAGNNSAREQDSLIPKKWKATIDKPLPVVRCIGTIKNGDRAGERCGRWAVAGGTVCMVHGAQLPNVRKAAEARVHAAKMRLLEDSDMAIDTLFDLLRPGTAAQVQLGAAKEILDRAGIKGGVDAVQVEVTHKSNADNISERLKAITNRLNPEPDPDLTDEGEIIDEEQPTDG